MKKEEQNAYSYGKKIISPKGVIEDKSQVFNKSNINLKSEEDEGIGYQQRRNVLPSRNSKDMMVHSSIPSSSIQEELDLGSRVIDKADRMDKVDRTQPSANSTFFERRPRVNANISKGDRF